MIYVGIDVAKDKHDCHFISNDGEILLDNLSIPNSIVGFDSLKNTIYSFSNGNMNCVVVGLESTGHYSTNLISFLNHHNIPVIVLNALSVNRFRKSCTLRSTKTDKSDARYIAKVTMLSNPKPYLDISYHILSLKSLTRCRYRLMKVIQPIKNRFRRALHIVFPEFENIFNLSLTSSYEIIRKYPGPDAILKARKSSLESFLSSISHGRLNHKTDALILAAKNSIGSNLYGDIFELQFICDEILFLENKLSQLECKIKDIMSQINSPITSIKGIGDIMGATILAEIGDIHNFSSPEKLQAYAGLAPQIYESGKYVGINTPMDKKGSVYLRNALYQTTKAAYVTSTYMRSYIDRKRDQGKHFYTAISHGMRKMIRIIYAVLKKNSLFVEPAI